MKRKLAVVLLAALLIGLLAACSAQNSGGAAAPVSAETQAKRYTRLADFADKRIGVETGAIQGPLLERELPAARLSYYDSTADLIAACRLGKIDAFATSNAFARYLAAQNEDLLFLDKPLSEPMQTGAIFPKTEKGAALRGEFNAYLAQARKSGVIDELEEIWFGRDESGKTLPDLATLPAKKGILVLATDPSGPPLAYIRNERIVGKDIDLVVRFCQARGYGLKIISMNFSSLVETCVSGKCDLAIGDIAYTPERAESVSFSDPVYEGYSVLAYLRETLPAPSVTLEELSRARIGTFTGSNFQELVQRELPNTEYAYFLAVSDGLSALTSGKIDALAIDEPVARSACAARKDITYLPNRFGELDYGFILQKSPEGEALCAELNDFLRALKADGSLEAMQKKWLDCADPVALPAIDYRELPARRGVLRTATSLYPPFTVVKGDLFSGYEAELMALFCQQYGYGLIIDEPSLDIILTSVKNGKVDIGFSAFSITPEREEEVLFSEPYWSGGTVLIVPAAKTGQAQSGRRFFTAMAESFEKTFIRENRWKLFAYGIVTTLLITVLSILFGSLLGFGIFLLCRRGNPVANSFARFYVWLIDGMPTVVLLMILYYVVLGGAAVSGTFVSVIGFTLVFGSTVYSMVAGGVATVNHGQTEAAYALGYTDKRAFYRIVLPQAMPFILPSYKSQINALVKATSIVGYVAVQDLTKMGDIVRSRTYEAFFPLLAVAILYFIMAALLMAGVTFIERRFDPRRRSKADILKGVKTK